MNLVFWCPECESHHFGSSGNKGRCHGCGHEWDREQDYVYFVEVRRFTSRRIYEWSQKRLGPLAISAVLLGVFVFITGSIWLFGSFR